MRNKPISFLLGLTLLVTTLFPLSAISAPYVYVADVADSRVSIIDLATDSVINKVDLGFDVGPQNLILHPTRPHLYVTNYTEGSVTAIDVGTPGEEFIIATIDIGVEPEGLAFSPDGKKLYVAHGIDEVFTGVWKQYLTTINVDDTATDYNEIVFRRQFAQNDARAPYDMTVVESNGKLKAYISGRLEDVVYVVDIEGLNGPDYDPDEFIFFTTTINLGSTCLDPHGVATSGNGLIFVACQGNDELAIIDTNQIPLPEIQTVPVGMTPTDVALDPDGNYAYVVNTDDSTVSIIDISVTTYPALPTVAVGAVDGSSQPEYLAVGTDGALVYVSGKSDDTLTLIETDTHQVVETLSMAETTTDWGFKGVAPGEDVPYISVLEAKNYGEVSLLSSVPATFTITNDGTADLVISAIGGLMTNSYSIDSGNCIGLGLSYNDSCNFTVTFAPERTGLNQDSFTITSNASNAAGDGTTTIAVSGTGTTEGVVPTAPQTDATGATVVGNTVAFNWVESTDPLGRTLTYRIEMSKDDTLFNDDLYFLCDSDGLILAGSGLMSLLLLGGALRSRNKKLLLLASIFALTALLTACGGGGGGDGGGTTPATTVTSEAYTMSEPGTYFWKVAAIDSDGGMSPFSSTQQVIIP